jgi:septin family protein
LNTITLSQNGLEIEPINFHDIDMENIDNYYSSDTFKSTEKVIKKIKKKERGLTILYGDRGTGKTTIINYVATKLDRIVIFIPNNMIEHTINNPEFRKFLKRYDKPILVIDDCELILNEIYNKSNLTTTNLLQMVDGFLASTVDINVLLVFNTDDEDKIDHNLLECNNIIDVVEFTSLSVAEANDLSKLVGGKKYKTDARMIDVINKKSVEVITNIGF